MKSIYLAGPMSGLPEFNFPAFFSVAEKLTAQGWQVFNPAAKDIEKEVEKNDGFADGDAKKAVAAGFDFREAFLWDCDKVINSNGIFMLNGWEQSPGARAEHAVATFIKKNDPSYQIMYEGAA